MSDQTIFRNAAPDKPYTMILNKCLQDARLSAVAGWVLMFMLSQLSGWQFNIKHVAKHRRIGKNRLYAALNELISLQYCKRLEYRNQGKVTGYEYLFTDEPGVFAIPVPGIREPVKNPSKSPLPGLPVPVNGDAYKGMSVTNSAQGTHNASDTGPTEFAGADGLIPFDHVTDVATILENGKIEAAKKALGIDVDRLPFTAEALHKIARMHVDVPALVKRYLEKTKGRKFKNPDGYLMRMAQEAVAQRNGVPVSALAQVAKRSPVKIVDAVTIEPLAPVQVSDALRATLARLK